VPESARVLVDSSAWIDFLHGRPEAVVAIQTLGKAGAVVICGQIKQEVLQGTRDAAAFKNLEQQMSIWAYEPEAPEDFLAAARLYSSLRWKGITLPPSDCLIAAVALRLNLPLYSHDPDFDKIPSLKRHKF
jgi:predicted nucleic acid-binding protein